MSKYLAVFKISWEQATTYRLNFILWRVRLILGLLLTYFVWWTVFQSNHQIFGYTEELILTYVLVASVMRAVILSTRVMEMAGQITEGNIVNFFVKPIHFIKYYFFRDFADKFLNISFVIFEIILLIWLFKPPIIIQTDISILLLCLVAVIFGMGLFFLITFSMGLLAFWLEDSWAPFMLLYIVLEALGGGLFPIDILPKTIAAILLLTPFPYLLYFPTKIYLGTMNASEIVMGFLIMTIWILLLWFLMLKLFQSGIRRYTAFGG